jgi:hypothetical protein
MGESVVGSDTINIDETRIPRLDISRVAGVGEVGEEYKIFV